MKVFVRQSQPQQQAERQQEHEQQQQQRLKCGEVYTWDCTGEECELFAVECVLCSDRPLCKLSEYAEHMEIWHSQWGQHQQQQQQQQQQQEQRHPSPALLPAQEFMLECDAAIIAGESELLQLMGQEDDGVYACAHDAVQPFEQVLIAQEPTAATAAAATATAQRRHSGSFVTTGQESNNNDTDFSVDDSDCGLDDVEADEEDDSASEQTATQQKTVEATTLALTDPTALNPNNQIEFGLNEPLTHAKLSSAHIAALIALYEAQPRLWQQTHPEFGDRELNRRAWQTIAQQWSTHCGRPFSRQAVHMRIATLCKRYQKQREMRSTSGSGGGCGGDDASGCDDSTAPAHYQQLQFLDAHIEPFMTRRALTERNNRKLLEIYQHFPVLWHSDERHARRSAAQRERAYRSIATALSLCGIKFGASAVERRLTALRQRYRAERLRRLHCGAEGRTFVARFRHYEQLQFLDTHMEPYVCDRCGKLCQHLTSYREHKRLATADCCAAQPLPARASVVATEAPSELLTEDSGFAPDSGSDLHASATATHSRGATPTGSEASGSGCERLLVKVECGPYSYDLRLADNASSSGRSTVTETTDDSLKCTTTFARLTLEQTRQLIALYRDCPQLWDARHAAYGERKARARAWRALAAKINRKCGQRYAWRNIQRKITDFVKYYKRERQRSAVGSKWFFYADFGFLDAAWDSTSQIEKSLQQKANSLKIIEMYRAHPLLWNTQHADHSKRKERQRHSALMCARLAEANLQLSAVKLKQLLIGFRCNYRLEKQKRLDAERREERFRAHYEFYEALRFLEPHVAPFQCQRCSMTFKKRSDFVQHERKQHAAAALPAPQQQRRRRCDSGSSAAAISATRLDNVCHICGLTFTMRNNLVYHLKRHLGERQHACSMCPKQFYNSTALRVHERSHTNDRPYVCEQCGGAFVNASKLNQHRKRQHSQQRDYACTRCEKAFYTAYELDRHERRHLNIRDKVCPVCGRAFFVGSSYYAHMRLHSDVKRYACAACGLQFAQYAGLYKHRKRHHPNDCGK